MTQTSQKPQIAITVVTSPRGPEAVFTVQAFLTKAAFESYRGAVEGARYEPSDRTNRAPLDKVLPILHRLKDANFTAELQPALREALQRYMVQQKLLVQNASSQASRVDEDLKSRGLALYPYQRIGIEWLASRIGALLADAPGLGKSCQALAALPLNKSIMILCPNVMKRVWEQEANKWRPDVLSVMVLEGRGSFQWPEGNEIVIVNPDILPVTPPRHCPVGMSLVVDEAHMFKNHKAKRTERARVMAEAVRAGGGRTWALTGTPILNDPTELWSVLQLVGCSLEAFGSYKQFYEIMGGSVDFFGATRWSTSPNTDVVERLRRVSLRREKKDVLTELPEKSYRYIEVDLDADTTKLCDAFWKQLSDAGIELSSAQDLARLSKDSGITLATVSSVRAALATAKIPALIELVETMEAEGEPIIVFSHHRAPIDTLGARPGWETITGSNSKDAQDVAARFQRGLLKGVACTIKAGGVGITLTRAWNMIVVDRDWSPELNDQFEDRFHRIGQTRGVIVTDLVGNHTMDKHVLKVLQKKIRIIANTVKASARGAEERPAPEMTEDELRAAFADVVADNQKKTTRRYPPVTKQEFWALDALKVLTESDPDCEGARPGIGWSVLDGAVGKSLYYGFRYKEALSRKQWALAIEICRKYHAQVGICPAEVELQEGQTPNE